MWGVANTAMLSFEQAPVLWEYSKMRKKQPAQFTGKWIIYKYIF